ncbi:vacuolar H+/Ca2+ exchanger [Grosmannia clavigera kw1407]|uniref:Vacuolar calcium ion transporter n=1 Tax=Grosmannia clavigera (strain kw1407 / UAMH 11150) TaxID=655863 RepID=F0X957_GROCL|nr:vacuolar H+/Ca2+ exchanger [Grosmannia clavigera kw1407]EFX05581.1 vacuolar H+/Ca2+ exchanger [Grosmannia clavigera kw1407]
MVIRRTTRSSTTESTDRQKTARPTSAAPSMSLPVHQGDVDQPDGVLAATSKTRTASPASRHHSHIRFRIRKEGDSGRSGFHPRHFFRIAFWSSSKVSALVNILWPVVPAALACRYALADSPRNHLITFILSYIAMVPCANMIGFAGQELAHKVPHVLGILTETTVGSIVEIVLFHVLLKRGHYAVIQAAILGSILATMLLCLGLCFFVGGVFRHEQQFSETVSEAGTGLLLTAGFGLAVPTVFSHTLTSSGLTTEELASKTLNISRVSAILLVVSYAFFVYFQTRSHHGIYEDVFEGDEAWVREHGAQELDSDQSDPQTHVHARFTMTESIAALSVSVALVSLIAISLVEEIDFIVERGVSDAFMGLILVPLVEKAAEHLTAIDEAWDNQMNFALSHVLGATLQTAMFTGPLVVLVGWGLHRPMGLDFELFDIAVLILAIITVGNFLRDQKSNYLEGVLCVIVYISIAVAAFNYPEVKSSSSEGVD